MNRRMILPGFVDDALACMRDQGFASEPLLAAANLPDRIDEPITNDEYGRLWTVMANVAEDEFFGLAARPMRPGSFTLLCHAVLHARTLEQALRRALRFLNIVLDDPRGRLERRGHEAQVLLKDSGLPRPAFAYRTYWLILMGLVCWLVGRQIPLRRVNFACPEPPNRADYRLLFGAPVEFDSKAHMLCFDTSYLNLQPIRSEAAMKTFLRGAPANILVRYRHDAGTVARLRDKLFALDPSDWPNFECVAEELCLSPATLRRQLKAEGQSFQSIKDELRHKRALALLAKGDLIIAEIAGDLGFSEPSAFHRAFIKWMNMSPGAYRTAVRNRHEC